jgi:hypothetical protein
MAKQKSNDYWSKMMTTKPTTSLVVAAVAVVIQALSLPVMAEEIHGQNDAVSNLSLRKSDLENAPIGGSLNTAIGMSALGTQNSGSRNTAVGMFALSDNTLGDNNTAVGFEPLSNNTAGDHNTAVGAAALHANTTGTVNTATGASALEHNTMGYSNNAYGSAALNSNKTGSKNVAVGTDALHFNASGSNNIAIGISALRTNTIGGFNTAIGKDAGFLNVGSNNVFIGYGAGAVISNETAYAMKSNQLAIANSPEPDSELITGDFAEKTIGLNGSVTIESQMDVKGHMRAFQTLRVNKSIYTNDHLKVKKTATAQSFNTTSDVRLKQNIQPLNHALSSVLLLQGKTYRWKEDHHKQDIGLIAQEVEQVFPELIEEDANGFKAIAYSRLTAVLIEAIKEQQGQMTAQQRQMTAQQEQIATLEQENTQLKIIMADQMQALLTRVVILEAMPIVAN